MTQETSPSTPDHEVISWLAQQGLEAQSFAELTGDVSQRRYARVVHDGSTAIVAIYPLEIRPTCRRFLETTRLLSRVGVRVPRVLASDCELGLMLLEDVGTETLYDLGRSSPAVVPTHFRRASEDLDRFQALSVSAVERLNPPLDRDLLWRELRQTWSSLFEGRGLVSDPGFSRALQSLLEEICRLLVQDPLIPCHRDFMARNLVPLESNSDLAVLDHQDLRLGPRYYDLASLLNDSLFPSAALEEEILLHCLGEDSAERTLYHRAAAQRTLKATGTYETFALRGYRRHQKLIPDTLRRALGHLSHLPEAADVLRDLELRIAPLLIC